MKFKHKIWMLPLSAATFFAVGLLASFWVSSKTAASLDQLRRVDYPYLEAVQRLDRDVDQLRLTLQSAAAEGDAERMNEAWKVASQAVTALQRMAAIDGKTEPARRLQGAFSVYVQTAVVATEAMLKRETGHTKVAQMQLAQKSLHALLASEIAAATQATLARQTEADKGLNTSLLVNLMTGLVVLLMLANASSLIVRSVWRDLGSEPSDIRRLMNDVAMGRLDNLPEVAAKDTASIASGLRDMIGRMAETVAVIRQVAEGIKASTEATGAAAQRAGDPQDFVASQRASAKNRANNAQADRLLEAVSAFKLP